MQRSRSATASLILQCAAFAATLACAASAHQTTADRLGCGQEVIRRSAVLQRDAEEALAAVRAYEGPRPSRRAEDAQPIRFAASYEDLTTPGHFCRYVGEQVSKMSGGTTTCVEKDLLNSSRINYLKTMLMPEAMRQLSLLLKVHRVPGNLVVPQCSRFTVPDSHKTVGVSDADFVIYVSAAPTKSWAWAHTCAYDPVTGHPIAGYINLRPDSLDPEEKTNIETSVRLEVHELMHALGFSSWHFGNRSGSRIPTKTVTRRGKTVTVLAGPATIREARSWSGCADAEGVELADGSLSHLERRVYRDDVIGRYVGGPPSRISLAVFEDLGWYTPNYAALKTELAFQPEATFGRNLGCGFLRNKCTTPEGGLGTAFCSDTRSESRQCAGDMRGSGNCWREHYMNGCPTVGIFPEDQRCTNNDGSHYTQIRQSMGQTFGESSRCVMSTGFAKLRPGHHRPSTSHSNPVCLTVECVDGVLHVGVGNKTFACPAAGGPLTGFGEVGFVGTINCPKSAYACAVIEFPAPAPPVPADRMTAAPTVRPAAPPAAPRTPAPVPRTQAPQPRPAPQPRTPAPKPRTPAPEPRTPAPKPRTPAPKPLTQAPSQPRPTPAPMFAHWCNCRFDRYDHRQGRFMSKACSQCWSHFPAEFHYPCNCVADRGGYGIMQRCRTCLSVTGAPPSIGFGTLAPGFVDTPTPTPATFAPFAGPSEVPNGPPTVVRTSVQTEAPRRTGWDPSMQAAESGGAAGKVTGKTAVGGSTVLAVAIGVVVAVVFVAVAVAVSVFALRRAPMADSNDGVPPVERTPGSSRLQAPGAPGGPRGGWMGSSLSSTI